MNNRSRVVGLGLVILTTASMVTFGFSPTHGAMRAPLWDWIAGVEMRISDTDCTAKGGKIATHPDQGDKLFCDLAVQ